MSLGYTLGDDGDAPNLRGKAQDLDRAAVYRTRGREVDDNVDVGMLGNGLGDGSVDRQESLRKRIVNLRRTA